PVIGHARPGVDADGRPRRGRLGVVLAGCVAAPVADVAAVRPRTANGVGGHADRHDLLDLAAGRVDELDAVAAGGRDPELAVRRGGEPGRVGCAADLGRLQLDAVVPVVAAVLLAGGGAHDAAGVGDVDAVPAHQEADDAEAGR